MDVYKVNTVVIGAGVVGLAVARALSMFKQDVWIIDKHPQFGMETSSRNSEVIHAGIYYPKGSLKAKLCVEGKRELYQYCAQKDVPYKNTGKLIVASSDTQVEILPDIIQKAEYNGVDDLCYLNDSEVRDLEPELYAKAAVLSPSTGIVDSHALMQSFLHDAQNNGAQWVPATEINLLCGEPGRFRLELIGQEAIVETRNLVNAAGLYAPWLLRGHDWFPQSKLPNAVYAKGNYFSYSGKVPFKHLIYPVPEHGGLGVHLTLDLAGCGKFGPDVEWSDIFSQEDLFNFDYQVDDRRTQSFAERVKRYWPGLNPNNLNPAYAGLRPKLGARESLYPDFCIQSEKDHGLRGLVNLFGIESPGLTSSMAIAKYVAGLLGDSENS